MAIFNATEPANTEAVKLGAQRIREMKTTLNTLLSQIFDDALVFLSSWITTAMITDSNVTTAKIADSNVTTAKIADSNVTTAKIADSNVTTAKIADLNVTTGKLADSAVTNAKIADGTIEDAKLSTAPIHSYASGNLTIPVSASETTQAHSLGGLPLIVQAFLICIDAGGDRGYAQNQEVALTSFVANGSSSPAYSVTKDTTNIIVRSLDTTAAPRVIDDTGDYVAITLSKWRLKVVALK
jgi:hypothetical protein